MAESGLPPWASLLNFLIGIVSGAIIIVAAILTFNSWRITRKKKPKLEIIQAEPEFNRAQAGDGTIETEIPRLRVTNVKKGDAKDCRVTLDSPYFPFSGSHRVGLVDHDGTEHMDDTIGFADSRFIKLFTVEVKKLNDRLLEVSITVAQNKLLVRIENEKFTFPKPIFRERIGPYAGIGDKFEGMGAWERGVVNAHESFWV